eukprot:jgi/Psemu1/2811/gm1.2811_g
MSGRSSSSRSRISSCRSRSQKSLSSEPKKQQALLFLYSGIGDEAGFESLVEEATSGSKGLYGGDFAGLAATFDPGDGSFIPIPDYLIPESLKEWGQEPKCLQVLVSEDVVDGDNDGNDSDGNGDGDGSVMTRVTTKILPETGCGVDNLETMLVGDEIDLDSQWKSDDNDDGLDDVVGLQYPLGNDKLRVETIFGLSSDGDYEYGVDRVRVAIDLVPSEEDFAIRSPMVITLERRTSSSSSGGTISEGGGLDGRTVYLLLGERLRGSSTFVDEPSLSLANNENYYDPESDIRYVSFPANITIAYGWLLDSDDNNGDSERNTWMLQVSRITPGGARRVLSRQFTIANNGELDFEIRSWVEQIP